MKVINCDGLVLGRMATKIAKDLLNGEKIILVNCQDVVISGKKKALLARWKEKINMTNPRKGPYYFKMADRFVKRAIRGMIPYKKPRGEEAFKNLKCFIGVPDEFKDKMENLKQFNVSDTNIQAYLTVGQLCKLLGGKE